MPHTTRLYIVRPWLPFVLSMLGYIVVLIISLRVLAQGIPDGAMRVTISLAPMVPALFLGWSILSLIRSLDEMHRRLQLEAFALAFAGTALVTFSYGFLENAGFPKLTAFTVWPLMCGFWIVGVVMGRLRYR